MKNILLILFLISNLCFSQKEKYSLGVPRFKDSPKNMSIPLKISDLRLKTQKYIADNLDITFIKTYFKENDKVEFNLEFIINKNGSIDEDKILIHTQADVFNKKIKSIILSLPTFVPAMAAINKKPFPYLLYFPVEFYVNPFNKFVPILRQELSSVKLNIHPKEKLMEIADSLGHNFTSSGWVYTKAYFSTSQNIEIINIRVFSDHKAFSNKAKTYVKDLEHNNENIFKQLKPNKNYCLPVNLFLHRKQKKYWLYEQNGQMIVSINGDDTSDIPSPDEVPIYPGCEKKKGNKAKNTCMSSKVSRFIINRFNTDVLKYTGVAGKLRISVIYKIDKEGNVIDVKARAPHPQLEKEAERIINSLPKMVKPGFLKGKPIVVNYSQPIIFEVPKKDKDPSRIYLPNKL